MSYAVRMHGMWSYRVIISDPELPKINTIGITFTEGYIKHEHFELIIEAKLGIPENELYGIEYTLEVSKIKYMQRYSEKKLHQVDR